MRARLSFLSFLVGLVPTVSTQAGEVGHFTAGVPNIRDFAMPEPGFHEFAAQDRFQGQSIGLNFAIKF